MISNGLQIRARLLSVQVKSQVRISNFKSSHKLNASLTYLWKYKSSQFFFQVKSQVLDLIFKSLIK